MSGEEYLARKYCEPIAYWHCVHELSGWSYYTYNEINFPEYWMDAVSKYIGETPSAAAKQLHHGVEAARAEFRAKQARIYGNRKVSETEGMEDIYLREDKARDAFNAQKQACLRVYLKARETGKIERQRARRRHRCQGEGCSELLSGRARLCGICRRARHREAARVYRKRNRACSVISYTREISPQNRAFGYPDTLYRKSCGSWQGKAMPFSENPGTKYAPAIKPHKCRRTGGRDFLRGYTVASTS